MREGAALVARPRLLLCLLAGLLVGCGAARAPRVTGPQPVPYADTLPIAEPETREGVEHTRLLDAALVEEVASAVSIRRWTGPKREALNVTAFDDVVSSAWWERRSGYRDLSPSRTARGPAGRPPDTAGALTVIGPKAEGRAPGFRVRDAAGNRYLLKLDPRGYPRMSTGAEVVASRLLWAAGYHTPKNHAVVLDSSRVVVGSEARVHVGTSRERRMTRADVRAELAEAASLPDGRFTAMASALLPGEPKGPFLFEGTRSDDPNDYYPHQHRRELRGLLVVAAWVNHREIRPANTLNSYVRPGYLRHYLIDFGSALGSGTTRPLTPREQRTHEFDALPVVGRLLSLGFYRPAWETDTVSVIDPAVGWLPVQGFEPGEWRPEEPNAAFRNVTPPDGYWAAKIVASFSRADLEAVVEQGGYRRAAVRDTLVDILAHRRDATVAHWYARVSPLEDPRVRRDTASRGFTLRFVDAGLRDGPWSAVETAYRWKLVDEAGGREWTGTAGARPGSARQRLTLSPPGEPPSGTATGPAGKTVRPTEGRATLRVWIQRGGKGEGGARPARIILQRTSARSGYDVVGLSH